MKKIVGLSVLTFVFFVRGAQESKVLSLKTWNRDKWHIEGLKALQEGKVDQAYSNFLQAYNDSKATQDHKAVTAYWLGFILVKGYLIPPDFAKARSYFLEAKRQDYDQSVRARALLQLGMIHYYGLGVALSEQEADKFLKKVLEIKEASNETKISALFLLRRMYRRMFGSEMDECMSKDYYDQLQPLCDELSKNGRTLTAKNFGQLYQGRLWLCEGSCNANCQKALRCFLAVAENTKDLQMKSEAYFRAGKVLYKSLKHAKEGKLYLKKVLEIGGCAWASAMVFVYLGDMKRGKKDNKKALEYYTKAVEQEHNYYAHAQAVQACSELYEILQDTTKVDHLRRKASEQEYDSNARVKSSLVLGIACFEGSNGKRDLQAARDYFFIVEEETRDATMLNEAWYHLALMHQPGEFCVEEDYSSAFEYWKKLHTTSKKGEYFHRALVELGKHEMLIENYTEAESYLSTAQSLSFDMTLKGEIAELIINLSERKEARELEKMLKC